MSNEEEKVFNRLKYPGSERWRDLDAALTRGGYWEDGSLVRISDPELRPSLDRLTQEWIHNPVLALEFIKKIHNVK